jgi:hypothetical protein
MFIAPCGYCELSATLSRYEKNFSLRSCVVVPFHLQHRRGRDEIACRQLWKMDVGEVAGCRPPTGDRRQDPPAFCRFPFEGVFDGQHARCNRPFICSAAGFSRERRAAPGKRNSLAMAGRRLGARRSFDGTNFATQFAGLRSALFSGELVPGLRGLLRPVRRRKEALRRGRTSRAPKTGFETGAERNIRRRSVRFGVSSSWLAACSGEGHFQAGAWTGIAILDPRKNDSCRHRSRGRGRRLNVKTVRTRSPCPLVDGIVPGTSSSILCQHPERPEFSLACPDSEPVGSFQLTVQNLADQ